MRQGALKDDAHSVTSDWLREIRPLDCAWAPRYCELFRVGQAGDRAMMCALKVRMLENVNQSREDRNDEDLTVTWGMVNEGTEADEFSPLFRNSFL